MKKPNVGILGTGIYLPSKRLTAKEISAFTHGVWSEEALIEKLGIKSVLVPDSDDGTQEMGVKAALDCLNNTNVNPKDIDVVINVGEEWKEYPLTTSALYVIDKIGAVNAWGIDVQNRCSTTVTAMKMAKDMLISDEDIHMILIVGGYRNSDLIDFSNPTISMMYNLSAGGGAILLKKNHPKNLLLGTHVIADGSLARSIGVEIGGILNPITQDNLEKAKKSFRILEPVKMKKRLNEVSMTNWYRCIDEAIRKSQMQRQDIGYLAVLHIKRSSHEQLVHELKLSPSQTIYLEDYGHIGQIDQILSLHLALKRGQVKAGTVVCMVSAGIGYVWAANIIKWG